MTEKEVYQFYNDYDYVKVAYSEIEAAGNNLPAELLFEVHSAFDHLKRIHVDGLPEELCCEKAFAHLKRCRISRLHQWLYRISDKIWTCQ